MAEELNEMNHEQDYIDKLTEMKANSVPREEYERLRADNKKLLDAVFSGEQFKEAAPEKKEEVDIQGLRDELYGGRFDGTDLEGFTKTLQLRKALMDRGEPDPFVSRGEHANPTEADYAEAEMTARGLQEVVDYANGDPAVFRSELMRRTKAAARY